MFCAENWKLDGARAGVDGRAHADSGTRRSFRKSDVYGGSFSERVRQNQTSPDEVGGRKKRLPGVDGGRRYGLDDPRRGWVFARDQSRGGFFWRCARHQSKNERERDG